MNVTSPTILASGALATLLIAGCAGAHQATNRAATPDTRGLACAELPGGGGLRPFEDHSPGVTKSALLASHVTGYDRHEDELRPEEKVGVRYAVAAGPNTSRAYFERQVLCYRATRGGTDPRDPLLVPDVSVEVMLGVGSYLIDVTSDDRKVVRDLLSAGLDTRHGS